MVAGTLALTYLFILKPILDTTETISTSINESVRQGFEATGSAEIQRQIERVNRQVERAVKQPSVSAAEVPRTVQITRTVRGLTPAQARRLPRCVRRAVARPPAINRCFDRFSRR